MQFLSNRQHNGTAEDLGSIILASPNGRQIRAEKQGPLSMGAQGQNDTWPGPRAFPSDKGEATLR